MTRFYQCISTVSLFHSAIFLILTGIVLTVTGWESARAQGIQVEVDHHKLVFLSRDAETILVGNSSIANVVADSGNRLFVLGRHYGKTNLIALDAQGDLIAEMDINVTAINKEVVTLNSGLFQRTFNCTPRCERALVPTDDALSHGEIVGATMAYTGYADSMARSGAGQGGQ